MIEARERAGSSNFVFPRLRSSRVLAILVLVVCYAVLFYAIMHARARLSHSDGPPMFGAIVSELGERRAGMSSRPFIPVENQTTDPPRTWVFPPIDMWPSPPRGSAESSGFTPVTDAQPDATSEQKNHAAISKPRARRPVLSMIRWLRPEYPPEWALAGKEGSVLLVLRIEPTGQASEIIVTRSSGSRQLDESAVAAAREWRFAPPLWNGRPVEVSAQVEVRYHRSGD